MVVTIRDALADERFRAAQPTVTVEGEGLDRPIRWVFTNEREDVANFLSGGEMLIVDGSALSGMSADAMAAYVRSLADAKVAALVVELVEDIQTMPATLTNTARVQGLTLIGLGSRVPFVDLCQRINTAIVREQMRLSLEVDTMSSSLRERLSHADNIDAVAQAIADLFGESVAIFDADGLLAAQAGGVFRDDEPTVVIGLSGQSRPTGALEISQRATVLDEDKRKIIASIVDPVASLSIDGGARIGMIRHIATGPSDGIHATNAEAADTHAMLEALGFAGSCIYLPFALRLRSLTASMDDVSAMIEQYCASIGRDIACILDGAMLIGWMSADDAAADVPAFSAQCVHALNTLLDDNICVVHGKVATDTVSLLDGFAALRDVCNGDPQYGQMIDVMDSAIDRFAAHNDMNRAIRALIAQTIGSDIAASPVLLDTLCACFDHMDNKTGACEQLGIGRQTLYNRLDKVTQMIGIDHTDCSGWTALLLAAKLAKSRFDQRIS